MSSSSSSSCVNDSASSTKLEETIATSISSMSRSRLSDWHASSITFSISAFSSSRRPITLLSIMLSLVNFSTFAWSFVTVAVTSSCKSFFSSSDAFNFSFSLFVWANLSARFCAESLASENSSRTAFRVSFSF